MNKLKCNNLTRRIIFNINIKNYNMICMNKNENKNLNKVLKTSIAVFSVLTIINCIGIIGSSNALFEKSIDSKNNLSMKVLDYWAEPGVATTSITNLAKKDKTNLAYDETSDNNLRYIGKDPNNYVLFNNELWRIIGVMNNIDDGTGNKASRIKLIKAEPAYIGVAFDTNNVNDYSTSSIKTKLNEEYYNNMSESSKNMIDSVVWNLGSANYGDTANTYYSKERGENVYSEHATIWTGKVGIMYPSDYLYATSGSSSVSRTTCITETSSSSNINWEKGICSKNDFLFDNSNWQWTLTPYQNNSFRISTIFYSGRVDNIQANRTVGDGNFRPSLYLNSPIEITGGYGTKNMPYKLSEVKHVTGSNNWNADYKCVNGKGTLIACYYNDTKCDGGSGGWLGTGCTGNYSEIDPYYWCNTKLSTDLRIHSGNMSLTISC